MKKIVPLFSFLLLQPLSAFAFKVTPMVIHFAPQGDGATQTLTLENNGTAKIAVEIEATTRDHDVEGKESRQSVDRFLIYPDQLSLEPGKKRNVRVTWRGERAPKQELPFRIMVTQVPVDFDAKVTGTPKANLKFLFQYVASAYVTPEGVRPSLVIESHKRLSAPDRLEVVLKNSGNAHTLIQKLKVEARTPTGTVDISPASLEGIENQNLLPGRLRRWTYLLPPGAGKLDWSKVELLLKPTE